MPSDATKKTEWGRKARAIAGYGGLLLAALGTAWALWQRSQFHEVRIGRAVIHARYAVTAEQQSQGLGGVRQLPADQGMLFLFSRDSDYPFWMKDMHISLDIIWIDANKTVVTVRENISPETYPTTFTATRPARYVLEVPAGAAQREGIKEGVRAEFR